MKQEITARGEVTEDNEFRIYEREYFKGQVINNFKGKKIKIIVELEEKYVSNPQIKYYFGIVVKLIRQHYLDHGIKRSIDEIDRALRNNFLLEETVDMVTGKVIQMPMPLNSRETKVSTIRMMEFFEDIQRWAIEELDLYIPDPNEEVKNFGLVEPGQAA